MTDRPPLQPRVLLLELEVRKSERSGNAWYSGWLGRVRVVGFAGREPNARGHEVIKLYVEEPPPKNGPPRPAGASPGREGRGAWPMAGPPRGARPGAPGGRPAPDRGDELDDAIPF